MKLLDTCITEYKLFKVGGCVRDKLLGIKTKDIDYVYVVKDKNKSIDEGYNDMKEWMIYKGFKIFLETPERYIIRAKCPTNHVDSGVVADFTLATKEIGYTIYHKNNIKIPILGLGTLEEDLERRDFTINAMAETGDGDLIYYHNGYEHLQNKVLITPLQAEKTIGNDPLRFLRAIRFFVTKNFSIHENIYEAMKKDEILLKLKKEVSSDRIREEIKMMMNFDTPKSIRMLYRIDDEIPGLLKIIFDKGLWLEPTLKNKK